MAVYIVARDLANISIGTHQYIVMIPDSQCCPVYWLSPNKPVVPFPLGGVLGYIVGAQKNIGSQKKGKRLQVESFNSADLSATLEYFLPAFRSVFRPDYDAEFRKVKHNQPDGNFINRIFFLIKNFINNEKQVNIPYSFTGVNSNSWAQSVIQYAGGQVDPDFSGWDMGHDERVPVEYFKSSISSSIIPRVNQ